MEEKFISNSTPIPANLKQEYFIRYGDRESYHLRMEKIVVLPADPTHPVHFWKIQAFRPCDYQKYFKVSTQEQIRFLKAMNYVSAELIHDPTLLIPEEERKAKENVRLTKQHAEIRAKQKLSKEEARDIETAYRKGKKTATMNDIEAFMGIK